MSSDDLAHIDRLKSLLEPCGFRDLSTAARNVRDIATRARGAANPADIVQMLVTFLSHSADPDMALNNLERLLHQAPDLPGLFDFLTAHPHSLAMLLQILASSQYFSNLLVERPELVRFLWERGAIAVDPSGLRDEILEEIRERKLDPAVTLKALRRHRGRELLRIGFRDIILGEPLDRITRSISDLADALVQVAHDVALARALTVYGEPRHPDGRPAHMVVLALGKLGGQELNYSSDIDLVLIYDHDGQTVGGERLEPISNGQFFTLVIREMVNALSAKTPDGFAYRVDLRLRPHGGHSDLCMSLAATLAYYDKHGRTWERQALVKARPIAGTIALGEEFLAAIDPFVYRRFLSFVEINEIKAIKRQIEEKSNPRGAGSFNLKTGRGGIRDIEFVVQFLQLSYGGVHPELRQRNTLAALKQLVVHGCVNQDEHAAMETAYRFLRKAEHRLQFMFDLQRHSLPGSDDEMDKLAVRLGYMCGTARPGKEFRAELDAITLRNRTILRHLLTDLFSSPVESASSDMPVESDLILDPEPPAERIEGVLARYRFANIREAYKNLMLLASEDVPFLSSVRCRHFLAGIAPSLLQAVSEAPDPDMALNNLEKVTSSLGAKGVLWESLSHNTPMLRLYVHLCASSQFLSEILITNPGMIDELLDILIMNRQLTRDELLNELTRLLKGAKDIDPILHSFKNIQTLAIGVQDIMGQRTMIETTRQLSDLAEVILFCVAETQFRQMVKQMGMPTQEGTSNPSSFALVALGKLGGRELGYHGDLDLVLVYEADGSVAGGPHREPMSNFEFYTLLLQSVVKTISASTRHGRLYAIDLRLRPTGKSGALVTPLFRFAEYHASAAIWESLALTRARVIHGEERFKSQLDSTLRETLARRRWTTGDVDDVLAMRQRLEESRGAGDLKRGKGGQADVEFAVQLTQLRWAGRDPDIMEPNIWNAIDVLESKGYWPRERCDIMREGYTLLRTVESRLRIVYNLARNDLPETPSELDKLAHRCGFPEGQALTRELAVQRAAIRSQFLRCADEARAG